MITELTTDYRQRRAQEEQERAELRQANMAQLCAVMNCPDMRIRAWEKMYGLRMPSALEHPVLEAIAAATQLTLADVQNEQRLRGMRVPAGQI